MSHTRPAIDNLDQVMLQHLSEPTDATTHNGEAAAADNTENTGPNSPISDEHDQGGNETMAAGPGPGVTVGAVGAVAAVAAVAATTEGRAREPAGEPAGASGSSLAHFGRWTVVLDVVLLGLSITIHWWPKSSRPAGLFVVGLILVNWHGIAGRITPGHVELDEYGPGSREIWIAGARRNLRLSAFFILAIQTLAEMRTPVPFL